MKRLLRKSDYSPRNNVAKSDYSPRNNVAKSDYFPRNNAAKSDYSLEITQQSQTIPLEIM